MSNAVLDRLHLGTPGTGPYPIPASGFVVTDPEWGAVGDGITNDTAAIQAAIDATAATGGAVYLPATGTFLCGNLTVTNRTNFLFKGFGATIQWTGTASGTNYIGLQLVGTLTNCVFEDLILVGDGVLASRHAGIWNTSGQTFTNIAMRGNRISSVVFGLGLGATGSGAIQGLEISGNYLDTIVGTVAGVGYGIYHASDRGTASHVRIVNNEVSRAQRHSIYQGWGSGVVIAHNTIRLHRTGQSAPGSPLPAIECARSQDVTIANNVIDTAQDGGIEVSSGDAVGARNVVVSGNVITNGVGTLPGIIVGTSNPAVNGSTSDVTLIGNSIYTSGTVANPHLYIYECVRLSILGNSSYVLLAPGTVSSLYLAGTGETAGTSTYTNNVVVRNNLFQGTNNGGAYTPIELGSAFAASSARVDFTANRLIMPGNAFSLDGAQTNANVYVWDQAFTGLTTAASPITAGLSLTGTLTAAFPGGSGFVVNNSLADAGVTNGSYTVYQTAGAARWYTGMSAGGNTGDFDIYNNITAGLSLTINKTTQLVTTLGGVKVGTTFGCNAATPQSAAASGGALAAYVAGANGLDTGAHMSALHALVVAMRAALVANGIMS